MKTVTPTTHRTSDSTVRTTALTVTSAQSKPAAAQAGTAHRILNALMRALATPHI